LGGFVCHDVFSNKESGKTPEQTDMLVGLFSTAGITLLSM
jgi:hypothetical protein